MEVKIAIIGKEQNKIEDRINKGNKCMEILIHVIEI